MNTMEAELEWQREEACKRFEQDKDIRESLLQELQQRPVTEIEETKRVTTRRALLPTGDALGWERIMGDNDLLSINYLALGAQAARSVCRVILRKPNGRPAGYGTGFMVSPSLMLTNHHVLTSHSMALRSLVEFDFEDDLSLMPKNSRFFRLAPERFFYNHRGLDFALVAVHPQATDGTSLDEYGYLPLLEMTGKALLGESLSIIQHPKGSPKQIALRDNRVVRLVDAHFIHYKTDTQQGSSGSPVFNDQWKVVALHHAGVLKRNQNGSPMSKSNPTKVWRPEMGEKDLHWIANEGVRISAIFQHLYGLKSWSRRAQILLRGMGLQVETEVVPATPTEAVATTATTPLHTPATPSTPKAMTLDEFLALKNHPETTAEQLLPYLLEDKERSMPFSPAFRYNERLIIDPREGDALISWANSWCRNSRQRRYRKKIAKGGSYIKIVSEGDSWFQYPLFLHDVIDNLMDQDDLAVYSLGAAADLLERMVDEAEYIAAIDQEKPDFFLFSGAGNDLVGNENLANVLHQYDPKRPATEYPNAAFEEFEQLVRREYHRLFLSLESLFPQLKILCHGYSYAVPKDGGAWLGKPMRKLGITQDPLRAEILRVVMGRVNKVIEEVAGQYPQVRYLNLLNVVPENGWKDELHPNNAYFEKVAALFLNTIHSSWS